MVDLSTEQPIPVLKSENLESNENGEITLKEVPIQLFIYKKETGEKISFTQKEKNVKIHKGTLMTTDVFGPYVDDDALVSRAPKELKLLGEEMEAFGLIHVANSFKRKAAVLVTAVDSKFTDKIVSVEDRQTSLDTMITLALDSLI